MRRRDPGHLRIEIAIIHRERALKDAIGDRSRDRSAVPGVFAGLHHRHHDVLRMIVRRKRTEPRDVVYLSVCHRLRGARFSGDLHSF